MRTEERQSRCPACNPMHAAGSGGMGRAVALKNKRGSQPCAFCEDTRLVPVSRAQAYVEGLQGDARPLTAQSEATRYGPWSLAKTVRRGG